MISTNAQDSSTDVMIKQLTHYANAGGGIVQIRTREPMRAAETLRLYFAKQDAPYQEWDITNGWRSFTTTNYQEHVLAGTVKSDFINALERPVTELRNASSSLFVRSNEVHYFAYVDPQAFLANNPYVLQLIQQYAAILPSSNVQILFITNLDPLPGVTPGSVLVADFPTPTVEELEAIVVKLVKDVEERNSFRDGHDIDEEALREISVLGLGLSLAEFEAYTALSIIEADAQGSPVLEKKHIIAGVSRGKTAVVKQSEILELLPTEDMSNVGGMNKLKEWIAERAECYSEEAREFGIEYPKGAALVGVPGTGKSLASKAIASTLGVPLVRLDFARVFSKYVGDSESRVRSALRMIEDMAPCVAFVDEIDKGLGGAGNGGGDGGTSTRVLGTYLTWLQELKAPVFNIVTANRVTGLPPELLRRGRFDQIFSVGMPSDNERVEVLAIHLRRRNRDISDFTQEDIIRFVTESKGYVQAEIESVVKDALIAAFHRRELLKMDHIIYALKALVPMSRANEDAIRQITEWAKNNATPVSDDTGTILNTTPKETKRRLFTPTRESTPTPAPSVVRRTPPRAR